MTEKQILNALKKIRNGIECDNFTWENITSLMEKIEKKGVKENAPKK